MIENLFSEPHNKPTSSSGMVLIVSAFWLHTILLPRETLQEKTQHYRVKAQSMLHLYTAAPATKSDLVQI